ncbi:MAG: hypothetical protein U9N56_09745 [Actinomycetota bacterium]|nr:hypothetical protein [Actinomycetota bacterium]
MNFTQTDPSAPAGRADLQRTLETMGIHLSTTAFERAFARVSMATNQWGTVTEAQVKAIAADASTGIEVHEGVVESFR